MKKPKSSAGRGKLNTRTFAVRDAKGNIFVTVPVLLYKRTDPGYAEMAKYFTAMDNPDSAVPLQTGWCAILPLNSSTNDTDSDKDDE